MRFKKPNILYSFDSHMKLENHRVGSECIPEMVRHDPSGTRWRCMGPVHDFYGYDTLDAAKALEIQDMKSIISERQAWLKKLEKSG